ncbi:hypothetical protein HMPREF9141_0063 [Prevotella multiformis DSM 16608]|uniref:Uncharacterized protein n=1 Tax=Prevotella multiformis DSM 16608 TaxID=888743 RepID=F0F397_9BACT|nr:hypothetical protein HMPREF9141_0063 [Prevotella multiformis DSM 16608]
MTDRTSGQDGYLIPPPVYRRLQLKDRRPDPDTLSRRSGDTGLKAEKKSVLS